MSRQKLWSKIEIELLKKLFFEIDLQSCKSGRKSKTILIKEKLKENGFERTPISIRRKLYRLCLTDFDVKNEKIHNLKCSMCKKEIEVKDRYFKKYKLYQFNCYECNEIKRRNWSKTKKGKKYHKKYRKKNEK